MTTNSSTSRPQILHVAHSLEPGGTERMLCRLVEALDGDGADHHICSLRDPRPFEGTLGENLSVFSLSAGDRDRFLYRKLSDAIRQRHIDIVHARNWGTWTDAALACRSLPNVQLILGFHGLQNGQAFSTLQRIRAKLLGLSSLPATTVSNAARNVLTESLGFDSATINVIPNGVDGTRFAPRTAESWRAARTRFNLSGTDLVIGSVANFFEWVKGLDVLISSFAEIAASNADARLVLVGYGPLESEIRSQIDRLNLTERVMLTGRVERVEEVLPAFDVFVCSSRSEGLSNAVLEAMATGLACVVTDVSDHREMFERIDPESIVPPEDAKRLAAAILRLLNKPGQRNDNGVASRLLVERKFDFATCTNTYKALYDQLLGADDHRQSLALHRDHLSTPTTATARS
ncbi:MAG: glycosyltransferase [Phycisphaerae bacterium]